MVRPLTFDLAGRCGAPPASLRPWVAAAALLAPALAAWASPAVAEALQYDRVRLAAGEWWRVLTAHWAHWTTDHFVWDAVAFLALIGFALTSRVERVAATVVTSALAVSAAVWFALPEMILYRGLSGIDSALFTLLGVTWLRREWAVGRDGSALWIALVLAFFPVKIAYEFVSGGGAFVAADGFVPVPLAHVVGALVGLAFGIGQPLTAPCRTRRRSGPLPAQAARGSSGD